jgi:hypothetical protein
VYVQREVIMLRIEFVNQGEKRYSVCMFTQSLLTKGNNFIRCVCSMRVGESQTDKIV